MLAKTSRPPVETDWVPDRLFRGCCALSRQEILPSLQTSLTSREKRRVQRGVLGHPSLRKEEERVEYLHGHLQKAPLGTHTGSWRPGSMGWMLRIRWGGQGVRAGFFRKHFHVILPPFKHMTYLAGNPDILGPETVLCPAAEGTLQSH